MGKDRKGVILAYVGVTLLLLPFPLFGILHVEASAVVAAVAFLISALATPWEGLPGPKEWRDLLLAAFLPSAILFLSMLWRPNCGWLLGLTLYALFVIPSVLLGAGVGAAVRAVAKRFRTVIIVGIWLFLIVVPSVLTVKSHPQFFVYNAVFGGVLGPIYDDELSLRAGLFWHRLRTLAWAAWLLLFVRWKSSTSWRFMETVTTAVLTAILGLMYLFQLPLGIVQTEHRIAQTLGAQHRSASLVIHYDSLALSHTDAALIAREQEYRLEKLSERLDLAAAHRDEPIHVFIYPDEEAKGWLTGARRTSVAPVWLEIPQVHVLQDQIRFTLTHELVHVVARSFGQRWTGASWSLGLVEGLAAALEPHGAYPELEAQVVAASQLSEDSPASLRDPAGAAASMMTPWRFWTSRPAIAYAVEGAFTEYLLETYGAHAVKQSYRTASFEDAYGQSLDSLASEWTREFSSRRADSSTVAWVQWAFSQPSVFELRCPHYVPRWVHHAREGADLRREGQFQKAFTVLEELREERPNDSHIASEWAGAALAAGVLPDSVAEALDVFPDSLAPARLLVRKGDARRMAGRQDAETAYERAIAASSPFPATARAFIHLRSQLGREALRLALQATDDDSLQIGRAQALERWPEAGVFAASFYASAGRYAKAWDVYQNVYSSDSARRDVESSLSTVERRAVELYALDWAIAANRLDEAEDVARRHLEEGDGDAQLNSLNALAADRLGYIQWLEDQRP